jgi:geranylgeranyl pyrophosphate synthase
VSAVADLDAILSRHSAALEGELRAAVPALERSGLYRLLRYHLGWLDAQGNAASVYPGKRLRPTLLLLADEAAGGDPTAAMPAAAAAAPGVAAPPSTTSSRRASSASSAGPSRRAV